MGGKVQPFELVNAAVSTSGDTEQFLEIDGKRYSHIVDPATGLGLTERRQVTVIAERGIESDSLATALSVMSPGNGVRLIFELDGTASLVFRAWGDRKYTAGWTPRWPVAKPVLYHNE
mgnify:CR=1 FL=1